MFFMEGLSGVKFKVYGDVPTKKDPVNALLVSNHQCVSDWIVIDSFAMRLGNAGQLKNKNSLSKHLSDLSLKRVVRNMTNVSN